ncbi:uncharacterized protein CIMG_07821 [Coccidioides immitis RS]|uniref:NDT80 domain-containing protein n=1 Tax=Coccidioides immitis (strain RS) TaxID=246410 RepID=J3K473_COCIM|nr:uncharacterized protein CIMG_07821 [Coccidioides immitis RS]EAS29075.3 hypothetical protein CIMG_07821 [Coccidioides immitis RS]
MYGAAADCHNLSFCVAGEVKNLIVSSAGSSPDSAQSQHTAFSFASLPSSNVSPLVSVESDSSDTFPSRPHPPIVPSTAKMVDYRYSRMPPLQPPSGMPHTMQSPGTMLPSSGSMISRGDSYSMYGMSRNGLSVAQTGSSYSDTTRYHQYPTRSNDISMSNTTNGVYGTSGNLFIDSSPRLTLSNSDSPPWHETEVYYNVMANGQAVKPEIQARIHKGFFIAGGYWTCYRRNYFSVSVSFALRPWSVCTTYLIQRPGRSPEKVLEFGMKISAFVNGQEKETRELIQHTPKRDKQSESKPRRAIIQPQPPPSLLLNHGANNTHLNFGLPPSQSAGMQMDYGSSYGAAQQSSQIPTSHTWERIQFQKATANNGKRRAQQQFYNLVAELWADVSDPLGNGTERVMLARKLSHPVVVRGRSPGHYKDAKQPGSGRMATVEGETGSSTMGHLGIPAGLNPPPQQPSRSHISSLSYDPIQRNGSQYDYRRMPSTDQSPLTASSLVSSSSSSPGGYDYTLLNDPLNSMQSMTTGTSIDGYGQPAFASAPAATRRVESLNVRCPLPSFDDATNKSHDQNDVSLGEPFDHMIPMLNNDHGGTSRYIGGQASNGYANQEVSRPSSGGRLASYPARSEDHAYGRYDPHSHTM